MVPGVKPVILLVKVPVPILSDVWLLLMVGLEVVLQHTPRTVIGAPPSLITLPPEVAVVAVMPLAEVVVITGTCGDWGLFIFFTRRTLHPMCHKLLLFGFTELVPKPKWYANDSE